MYCSSYIAEKPPIPTLTLKFGRCTKKLAKFRRSTQDLLKALDVYNIITKFHEYIKMHANHPLGQEYKVNTQFQIHLISSSFIQFDDDNDSREV